MRGKKKKGMKKKREEMRTQRVSKFETTANKSESVALLEGDAWIISQCQVKWLPVSTPKTPPSCALLLALPLSCHVTLYFPVHPPHRRVVVVEGEKMRENPVAWP